MTRSAAFAAGHEGSVHAGCPKLPSPLAHFALEAGDLNQPGASGEQDELPGPDFPVRQASNPVVLIPPCTARPGLSDCLLQSGVIANPLRPDRTVWVLISSNESERLQSFCRAPAGYRADPAGPSLQDPLQTVTVGVIATTLRLPRRPNRPVKNPRHRNARCRFATPKHNHYRRPCSSLARKRSLESRLQAALPAPPRARWVPLAPPVRSKWRSPPTAATTSSLNRKS